MRLRAGLAALLLLPTAALAAPPGEDPYRWRLSVKGVKAHLFAAEDAATDFTGALSFRCQQGEGKIEVGVTVDSTEEKAFARIIADDVYPAVKFRGAPGDTSSALIERITFGELGGWEFHFTLAEDAAAMDAFEKTGALALSVGTVYATEFTLQAGLDAITAFRRHCWNEPVSLRR
ncbi:hypothetical protein ASG52_18135 [Methylobacterium sp. Leaf456]|uniref:hypothetical protein n=1 Tax=Methylobacterium sp. Leaf456 TaxID=1736382 RepID=UPI0006F37F39|nr:hypothetical protein [Methylobacterium sp. Leaf456]KQT60047.1 hypothetical protein ASG52_18135 [Methylobacterium sp. Leaf456]